MLPYGFFISWCINLCFNIGWLLVWDRGWVIPLLQFVHLSVTNMSDTDNMKVHLPSSPLLPKGWWFLHWFFFSWSSAPTTPWCFSLAADSTFMELGFIKTTEQICGSSMCWLVWQQSVFASWDTDEASLYTSSGSHGQTLQDLELPLTLLRRLCVLMVGILFCQVQNGVMIYTTWTTIATLINLTIVLTYNVNMSPTDAASVSYSILAFVLLAW